jgi:hypothetical protein
MPLGAMRLLVIRFAATRLSRPPLSRETTSRRGHINISHNGTLSIGAVLAFGIGQFEIATHGLSILRSFFPSFRGFGDAPVLIIRYRSSFRSFLSFDAIVRKCLVQRSTWNNARYVQRMTNKISAIITQLSLSMIS